jgi:hypothetical protein
MLVKFYGIDVDYISGEAKGISKRKKKSSNHYGARQSHIPDRRANIDSKSSSKTHVRLTRGIPNA